MTVAAGMRRADTLDTLPTVQREHRADAAPTDTETPDHD